MITDPNPHLNGHGRLTIVSLICRIARKYNLDTAYLVDWVFDGLQGEFKLREDDILDDANLALLLRLLEAQETQSAAATGRVIISIIAELS